MIFPAALPKPSLEILETLTVVLTGRPSNSHTRHDLAHPKTWRGLLPRTAPGKLELGDTISKVSQLLHAQEPDKHPGSRRKVLRQTEVFKDRDQANRDQGADRRLEQSLAPGTAAINDPDTSHQGR